MHFEFADPNTHDLNSISRYCLSKKIYPQYLKKKN